MINYLQAKSFLAKNKSKLLEKALLFIFLIFTYFTLGKASVVGMEKINFGAALLFALLYCRCNFYFVGVPFLIGGLVEKFSQLNIASTVFIFLVAFVSYILCKKTQKKLNLFFSFLCCILSQVVFIYFKIGDAKQIVLIVLSILFTLIFLYVSISFLYSVLVKGFNFEMSIDEKICGSIMLIVLCLGLNNMFLFQFEVSKFVVTLTLLFATYIFNVSTTLCVGTIMGIGSSFSGMGVEHIASFVTYALLSTAFKSNVKIFSVLSIILVEIVFGLYFKIYQYFSIFSVLSVAMAGLVFLILPNRFLLKLKEKLNYKKEKVAIRNIVNRSKDSVCEKLNSMAKIFNEMNIVFKNMVKNNLSQSEAKELIIKELVNDVCNGCMEKNKCLRINGEFTNKVFDELVDAGFEKGKVSLIDVSQYLSTRCGKMNFLLSTLNSKLEKYNNFATMVSNMNSSKILIAENLYGVGDILKNLSANLNKYLLFDTEKENRIIEELCYMGIICNEAIVYEEDIYIKQVILLVNSNFIKEKEIEKIVSKICKVKMKINKIKASDIANLVNIELKSVANSDVVYGSAKISKSGMVVSGDTQSIIKMENDNIMIALCDGMGTGENAYNTSALTMSLIENFYKAGFNNDIILDSVNRLLSVNGDEEFSALDICVINPKDKSCDFIKLGVPNGFIKHLYEIETIETSSLPIGILEDVKPHITKKQLQDFDTIVLVTDGIVDAFYKKDIELKEFVNNVNSSNPQTLADEILDKAIDLNSGYSEDDMSVLCIKIFPI